MRQEIKLCRGDFFLFREETEEFQSCAFKEEDVTTEEKKEEEKKVTLLLEGF